MGGGHSKNTAGGNEVALDSPAADKHASSNTGTPVRPKSLSPSKSPSPNRPEMAAIQIPETSKDLPLPTDPRSPTNEMSRTPLIDAAPFNDPRSPDNNILRTPLDKNSGFKGFQPDESLPYIDESQESSKPPSSPPQLSLSPLNLDDSGEGKELEGGGGGGTEEGSASPRIETPEDLSLDLSSDTPPETFRQSVDTPPDGFIDTVKEFDAAIEEELELDDSFHDDAVEATGSDALVVVSQAVVAGNVVAEVADGGAEVLREHNAGVKLIVSDGVALANDQSFCSASSRGTEEKLLYNSASRFTPSLSITSFSDYPADYLSISRQSKTANTSSCSRSKRIIEK